MHKLAEIKYQNNEFLISGELDFSNVMDVYMQSLTLLPEAKAFSFNFSQVKSSSSAALALILEWMKYAKNQSKVIHIKQLSPELMALATAAGIDGLLL